MRDETSKLIEESLCDWFLSLQANTGIPEHDACCSIALEISVLSCEQQQSAVTLLENARRTLMERFAAVAKGVN
jgi:hypothetical protein